MTRDINILTKTGSNNKEYIGAFKTDFNIEEIKQFCKQKYIDCSVNDYYFALISTTFYRYMERRLKLFKEMK
jgi:hypothetical protein